MTLYSLAHRHEFTHVVRCDSLLLFVAPSAHSELHVVPKLIRFMPYGAVRCELKRLLTLHSVYSAPNAATPQKTTCPCKGPKKHRKQMTTKTKSLIPHRGPD